MNDETRYTMPRQQGTCGPSYGGLDTSGITGVAAREKMKRDMLRFFRWLNTARSLGFSEKSVADIIEDYLLNTY